MSDEQLRSEQGDSPRIVVDPNVHEPYGLADASALPFRVVAWTDCPQVPSLCNYGAECIHPICTQPVPEEEDCRS